MFIPEEAKKILWARGLLLQLFVFFCVSNELVMFFAVYVVGPTNPK